MASDFLLAVVSGRGASIPREALSVNRNCDRKFEPRFRETSGLIRLFTNPTSLGISGVKRKESLARSICPAVFLSRFLCFLESAELEHARRISARNERSVASAESQELLEVR